MSEELEERLLKPIVNASYPGTLAALSLAALQVMGKGASLLLKIPVSFSAILFILSAFSIFFYTIDPRKRILWICTASGFLLGLGSSLLAVVMLILA